MVPCHTATALDSCYKHVLRAQNKGVDGFPQLNGFEELQELFFKAGAYNCTWRPCAPPAWEDPQVNEIHKERPRATFWPHATTSDALDASIRLKPPEESKRVMLLTGPGRRWSFLHVPRMHLRPSVCPHAGMIPNHAAGGWPGRRASLRHSNGTAGGDRREWPQSYRECTQGTGSGEGTTAPPFYDRAYDDSSWQRVRLPFNPEVRSATSHSCRARPEREPATRITHGPK
jgi:hypothetical protein